MQRRVLIVLLLLVVAGLWWSTQRRTRELAEPGVVYETSLFPDLDPRLVTELGIESLERGVEIRLARDPSGAWRLVDPIEARAYGALVQALLDELVRGVGEPAGELELGAVALRPPRAVITFAEERADGVRRGRLEIGAPGVENRHVHARVPGHPVVGDGVLRASRTLDSLVDISRDHYRDPLLLERTAADVLRIERRGTASLEGGPPVPLDLVLERDGQGGWGLVEPVGMKADRDVANTLLRAAQELRAEQFLPPNVERRQLDEPSVEVSLVRVDGTVDVVALSAEVAEAPAASSRWMARIAGVDAGVDARSVLPLLLPAETFFDTQLVRALRTEIESIELVRGERTLRVARHAGDWTVTVVGDASYPASHGRVEDLLAAFERAQIASFPPMVGFPVGNEERSFRVRTRGGAEFAGRIGATWRDDRLGAEGLAFQREGDALPALIGFDLERWFELDVNDYRRRLLWKVTEGLATSVLLERDGRVRSYRRTGNLWSPADLQHEADVTPRVFYPFLERLLAPRVSGWLDATDLDALDAVSREAKVTLTLADGATRVLRVGSLDGRAVGRLPAGGAFELDPVWLEELDRLLD
ncbi:MAG: DUF4340 domain-containing protein [Planctomycetota bacterium]